MRKIDKSLKSLVESNIEDKHYVTLPSGNIIVCELVLRNGYTVVGDSGIITKKETADVGKIRAYEEAFDKALVIIGYLEYKNLFDNNGLEFYENEPLTQKEKDKLLEQGYTTLDKMEKDGMFDEFLQKHPPNEKEINRIGSLQIE